MRLPGFLALGGSLLLSLGLPDASAADSYSQLKNWAVDLLAKKLPDPAQAGWKGWASRALIFGGKVISSTAEHKAVEWLTTATASCVSEPKSGRDLFPVGAAAPVGNFPRTIFVNGVWTDQPGALACGRALAEKIGAEVEVLHNPGQFGSMEDLKEAALDKSWPFLLGSVAFHRPIPHANPTTAQLAWLLLQTPGRINLVTHSQGCLIARNALLVAALRDRSLLERVNWIALASPLREQEYVLTPAHFKEITQVNDVVAQQLGRLPWPNQWPGGVASPQDLGWKDLQLLDFHRTHGFVEAYVSDIRREDLWTEPAP